MIFFSTTAIVLERYKCFERQDYDEKQNSWYFWIYSRNREL